MFRSQKEYALGLIDEALSTNKYSLGPRVLEFEEKFAEFCGRKYAISVNSGTNALMIAAKMGRFNAKGKTAIVPEMTVPMVKWAMHDAGLEVQEEDVEDDFLLADSGPELNDIVVAVSTAGIMNTRFALMIQAMKDRGTFVIEDASHSHGAKFVNTPAGGFGTVAAFSFYATKVMHSAGEGGMLVMDDRDLYEHGKMLVNAGKVRGGFRVEVRGHSIRMSEIQACVGLSFMKWWPMVLEHRNELADVYRKAGIKCVQDEQNGLIPTWYKYTVRVANADVVEAKIKGFGGSITARTHGPDDSMGGFKNPKTIELGSTHVNLPIAEWTTKETAQKTAEAFLRTVE